VHRYIVPGSITRLDVRTSGYLPSSPGHKHHKQVVRASQRQDPESILVQTSWCAFMSPSVITIDFEPHNTQRTPRTEHTKSTSCGSFSFSYIYCLALFFKRIRFIPIHHHPPPYSSLTQLSFTLHCWSTSPAGTHSPLTLVILSTYSQVTHTRFLHSFPLTHSLSFAQLTHTR
jgi:hypothetical protein